MKIAIIFDGLNFGGIERVGIDYVKMLIDEGHQVDVYNINPKDDKMIAELSKDVKYYPKNFPVKLCPDLYSYGTKKWAWGKYVYPFIYLFLKSLLYIRKIFRKRKKYDLSIAFSGHIRDLTFVGYNFLRSEKKLCWLHGGLADYLLICDGFGSLYKKIKNLVCLSDLLQTSALIANKFLNGLNIKKIYNPTFVKERPIDEENVKNLKKRYGDFALFVGRFSKQKDHRTVIDAIKILRNEYKLNNKFVFVGDGDTRAEMEKYAANCDVDDLCVFEGTKSDVQNYYKAAKLFIHSSPVEGLPTVIIEAMSLGLPVVATNSLPGVYEILQNKYGLVVEIGNSKEMADALYRMFTQKELATEYNKLGLERAQVFDPEHIKKELSNYIFNLDS